jgi:peroxiredoxin
MFILARRGFYALSLALILAVHPTAYAQSTLMSPVEMLKWSMSKYANMTTFHADCKWRSSEGDDIPITTDMTRTIWYKKPNIFKLVTTQAEGTLVETSVCDGTRLLEYITLIGSGAQQYPVPSSIGVIASVQLRSPWMCGSLLYKFFNGSEGYSDLVDEAKQPVMFVAPEKVDGHSCRTIEFWAQGNIYGKADVTIGLDDGLVYRIRYSGIPGVQSKLAGETRAAVKEALLRNPSTPTRVMTEQYLHISVGMPIEAAIFNTPPPSNMKIQDMSKIDWDGKRFAPGATAPEFSVAGNNGVKHSLADYQGQVVLIDFWETSSQQSRTSLLETQKLFADYGSKGLAVLTISTEPNQTVRPFLKANGFTFPTYADTDSLISKAYNISRFPTVIVIDKSGKLVLYRSGLASREAIAEALKKAGLDVK